MHFKEIYTFWLRKIYIFSTVFEVIFAWLDDKVFISIESLAAEDLHSLQLWQTCSLAQQAVWLMFVYPICCCCCCMLWNLFIFLSFSHLWFYFRSISIAMRKCCRVLCWENYLRFIDSPITTCKFEGKLFYFCLQFEFSE